MNASTLRKYPSGFLSLKAQETNGFKEDYVLHQQGVGFNDAIFETIALNIFKKKKQPSSRYLSIIGVLVALLGHAIIFYVILTKDDSPEFVQRTATPITVSIIAPPAPEPSPQPEIVPIIKPVKPVKKTVIKPKKVVKKIVPVEDATQPLIEATTEPVIESLTEEEMAVPVVEQKAAPEPLKATKVEEIIEQPKFGVAYLNNPAPNYPRLSRRIGEEGRVLLKVLVSEQGAANAVEIDKSSGFARLDQSAVDAVKRWKFVPARKGTQALSAYVLVPINFLLDGN
ncbi:MAG: energy transducer TonB [Methylophilaceae bacterium]